MNPLELIFGLTYFLIGISLLISIAGAMNKELPVWAVFCGIVFWPGVILLGILIVIVKKVTNVKTEPSGVLQPQSGREGADESQSPSHPQKGSATRH